MCQIGQKIDSVLRCINRDDDKRLKKETKVFFPVDDDFASGKEAFLFLSLKEMRYEFLYIYI